MDTLKNAATSLWQGETGLTVVEYAIAGGLIGATVIGAFILLGGEVGNILNYIYTLLGQSPGAGA